MKRTCLYLAATAWMGLAVLSQGAQTQPASTPASEPASKPLDLGQFAPMADDCVFSDEQKVLLAKKAAALRELASEEERQSKDILEKLAQAYKDKDNEQIKRLQKEMGYLREAAAGARQSLEADAFSVLTEAQRAKWGSAELQRQAMARYRKLDFLLVEAQIEKLQQACLSEGQTLGAEAKPPAPAKWSGAMSRIDQKVLTAEQRRRIATAE